MQSISGLERSQERSLFLEGLERAVLDSMHEIIRLEDSTLYLRRTSMTYR